MRISFVICTFNNLPYLQVLMESLRRYSTSAHEIIVSVDGSEDGTVEWLQEQARKETYHTLKFCYHKNAGIARTLNEGRRLATCDYIHHSSDDMVLSPGWDKDLDRFLNPYSVFIPYPVHTAGSHGGFRKEKDGSWVFPWVEAAWTQNYETFDWKAWEAVVAQYAQPKKVMGRRYFWGEILAHRFLWKIIGGFDESNDVEFGFRCEEKLNQLAQRHILLVTRIKSFMVFHFGQKTKWRFKNWKEAQKQEDIQVYVGPAPKGPY